MWGQIINTVLGIWLMAAPGFIGATGAHADNGHIAGPIIVTFAVVSYWEATRNVRKWNYPVAAWLLLAPWILGYTETWAIVSDMGTGVLVAVFASVKGKVESSFGGGWKSLWQDEPAHMKH
ncbi:hypothetical protein [Zunongwangia sp. H14]|uniref:SPW repeat domain-containing protein n=1 Tax=Zunongwangia sp. H14 TaxID=3240792 RepID=UPI003561CF82